MRPLLLTALAAVVAFSHARAQDVASPEEVEKEAKLDDYAREELGVNELTTPSIQGLFNDLEQFKPVPISLIEKTDFERTYNNRFQTSLNFGALICDGFFAVVAEQRGLVEKVGRSLLRQAKSLAVGQTLSTHANSLLEIGQRGDWAELKLELIKTQEDVEDAMIELRDEEMAHMISSSLSPGQSPRVPSSRRLPARVERRCPTARLLAWRRRARPTFWMRPFCSATTAKKPSQMSEPKLSEVWKRLL